MRGRFHPLFMLLPVIAVTLLGRALPTWTLSLATIAASNALVALGIVVLARTGNVSFGQGLFFAAGGYGVALIANRFGLTDAAVQTLIGAACGGLLGLVIGPLIARYTGIFFGMLTLALSMVFYGALLKTTVLGGSDGFNVGRPNSVRDPLHRHARSRFHALRGRGRDRRVCRDRRENPLPFRTRSRESRGPREQSAGGISRHLRQPGDRHQFRDRRGFRRRQRRVRADGATAYRPAIRLLDHLGRVRLRRGAGRGYQSVSAVFVASLALELVRSFSNLYLPNTWQLVLGMLPAVRRSCSCRAASVRCGQGNGARRSNLHRRRPPPKREHRREHGAFRAWARKALRRGRRRRRCRSRYRAGQKVSLIGANGAGKTTFVNMVTGYLKPDRGSIVLDGRDIIAAFAARAIARLGVSRSFQIPQLFVEPDGADNLPWPSPACHPRALSLHAPAEANGRRERRSNCCERFGLAAARRPADLGACRAGYASCSTSRWRWCGGRNCCCWTSRPAASRPRRSSPSWTA